MVILYNTQSFCTIHSHSVQLAVTLIHLSYLVTVTVILYNTQSFCTTHSHSVQSAVAVIQNQLCYSVQFPHQSIQSFHTTNSHSAQVSAIQLTVICTAVTLSFCTTHSNMYSSQSFCTIHSNLYSSVFLYNSQ